MLLFLLACTGGPPEEGCPGDVGTICRVAGTGDLGFNGEGLLADESWLYFPTALRAHPDGRLVVVDFNNMRLRAIEDDGTLVTIAGTGEHAWSTPGAPARETALENPIDVVWAPDGTAYVLPLHEARVLRWGADDTLVPFAGTGDPGYSGDGGDPLSATLSEAAGLAVGDDGALYVADTQNNAVRVVRDGVIATLAGSSEAGFVDAVGPAARFSGPQRLAVTADTLYVADANNHAIRAVDLATGAVTTVVGTGTRGYAGDGGPAAEASLAWPHGVAVGPDGALYVADSGNDVVRVVRDGVVETFAGTGEEGFSGDGGPATAATLAFPVHVLPLPDAVYVADMKNGAVRAIRSGEGEK